MQTQVTQTHTTAAVSTFSHADIVRVLGLAAMMDAGLPRDVPGTTITAELVPAEAGGEFTATVSVLIDHNYVAPAPSADDASLKLSDGATPESAPVLQPQVPQIPSAG